MRSLLFVPAVKKMLNKISEFSADAYIVDLEDSITLDKKEEALASLIEYLKNNHQNIYVRVDSNLIQKELKALSEYSFAGYMLPKFENPDDYVDYMEEFNKRKIIALVETPLGVVNIKQIASCEWVDYIAFGAEDFTASIGMQNRAEYLNGIRSRVVMFSNAFGKPVFDTPSFILDDPEALRNEVQLAQDMGFDGKMSINPKQLPVIDEIFKSCDVKYLQSIIDRYEQANEAVMKIDGKVYEKMHINHIKKILKERL